MRCKDELPLVERAYNDYKGTGFQVIGVGFQDTRDNIKNYVNEKKIPYPVAYDEGNRLASSYGLPYGAGVIFITKAGLVSERFRGGFSQTDFENELKEIL